MDSQPKSTIESYLDELNVVLGVLPSTRRKQEIEEISSHLSAVAASKMASGVDEETAAQNAIAQMGEAKSIGAKLIDEWEQTREATRKRLIKSIVGCAILAATAQSVINFLVSLSFNDIVSKHGILMLPGFALIVLTIINSAPLCIPICVGLYLAKQAPAGTRPASIVPAAVYTCVLFEILKFPGQTLTVIALHAMHVFRFETISIGVNFFLDATLCLIAYVAVAKREHNEEKTMSSNWKLRLD